MNEIALEKADMEDASNSRDASNAGGAAAETPKRRGRNWIVLLAILCGPLAWGGWWWFGTGSTPVTIGWTPRRNPSRPPTWTPWPALSAGSAPSASRCRPTSTRSTRR